MINIYQFKIKRVGIALTLFLLSLTKVSHAQQEFRVENNQKVGMNMIYLYAPVLEVTQISGNKDSTGNDPLTGLNIFYERVIRSQFGLGAGISLLNRSVRADILSVKSTVQESVNGAQAFGRIYFSRHRRKGMSFSGGAEFNYYQISSNFVAANENDDNPIDNQNLKDKKVSQTIQTYGINFGFDWLVKNSGIRANIGYMFGTASNQKSIENFVITYDYSTAYIAIGTFYFF